MSTLDEKLRHLDGMVLTEREIAVVKQAFADAGYLPYKPYVDIPLDQKQPEWWSRTPTIMTGQEWYDRFDKNLRSLVSRGDGETFMGWDCGEVRVAAKRAAGLE